MISDYEIAISNAAGNGSAAVEILSQNRPGIVKSSKLFRTMCSTSCTIHLLLYGQIPGVADEYKYYKTCNV